ncbi:MAG: hypothetical protein RPT25_06660 [Cycloclasticus sp.]
MKKLTVKNIQEAMKKLEHKVFSVGDYNVNLIGVRSQDESGDSFNDVLCCLFKDAGQWVLLQFDCTTDPGQFYLKHPLNVSGCAIVKPGQYPGLWKLGFHRNAYKALVQKGPVCVYRDNNGDGVLDFENEESGIFGINLHRATQKGESKIVHKWSAGCQVTANALDFDVLMALCEKSANEFGDSFTYTLLTEQDL